MSASLSVDRFDARIPMYSTDGPMLCPNCRVNRFEKPDVVCASCQQDPTFKAAVDAFNARQAARRQDGVA